MELRQISVVEYHGLIRDGFVTKDDKLELLDGIMVRRVTRSPHHVVAHNILRERIERFPLDDWTIRVHSPITLTRSEPEPDLAIARHKMDSYISGHPQPADIGLVVEVSDSTLDADQGDKQRIYADAGIHRLLLDRHLPDRRIEVYTQPQGLQYAVRTDYSSGQSVPVVLDGATVGSVAVDAILP